MDHVRFLSRHRGFRMNFEAHGTWPGPVTVHRISHSGYVHRAHIFTVTPTDDAGYLITPNPDAPYVVPAWEADAIALAMLIAQIREHLP